MTTDLEKERKAFEAAHDFWNLSRRDDGSYLDLTVDNRWLSWLLCATSRAALAAHAAPQEPQAYTGGGRNMFFDGPFDGETDRQRTARLRWADDMRAAFERHTGNGWFDKDWQRETALWSAAWHAATAPQGVEDATGQVEHLDVENHCLRRAMQKVMARLADLLDEDQFGNIESIVTAVGVAPPEPPGEEALTLELNRIF